ncbi:putative pentatricopeptide repeat-containing protein [Acorus gramineus]|uniref:Pentatricopeptide repeat-containing protein n=1 Tax=Acorus gramineus TaxID=55184 RepID=A0AAV9BWS7_ACOGR|nr:putative pentatricopeptide repeat-containing protein [Acorus gramineus]
MEKAIGIFEEMGERNTVSWNSLISGFTQNEFYIDSLRHFILIRRESKKSIWSMFACVLSACTNVTTFRVGEQLHSLATKRGFINNLFVANALGYPKQGKCSACRMHRNVELGRICVEKLIGCSSPTRPRIMWSFQTCMLRKVNGMMWREQGFQWRREEHISNHVAVGLK